MAKRLKIVVSALCAVGLVCLLTACGKKASVNSGEGARSDCGSNPVEVEPNYDINDSVILAFAPKFSEGKLDAARIESLALAYIRNGETREAVKCIAALGDSDASKRLARELKSERFYLLKRAAMRGDAARFGELTAEFSASNDTVEGDMVCVAELARDAVANAKKSEHYTRAAEFSRVVLSIFPSDAEAAGTLAKVLFESGDFEKSLSSARKAFASDGGKISSTGEIIFDSLVKLGRLGEARKFAKSLGDGELKNLLTARGFILSGKQEDAVQYYAKLVADETVNPDYFYEAADFFLSSKNIMQTQKIINYIMNGKCVGGQYIKASILMARTLMEEGNLRGAEKILSGVLRLNPNDPQIILLLSEVYGTPDAKYSAIILEQSWLFNPDIDEVRIAYLENTVGSDAPRVKVYRGEMLRRLSEKYASGAGRSELRKKFFAIVERLAENGDIDAAETLDFLVGRGLVKKKLP